MILSDISAIVKTVALGATSFIIGISWNDAIRHSVEKNGENKYVVAILITIITLIIVFVIALLTTKFKPHIEKIIPTEWFTM